MGKTRICSDCPQVVRVLRFGEAERGDVRCTECGEAAEYESAGECLCRECALDRWYLLPVERRLGLLGFEPIEQ